MQATLDYNPLDLQQVKGSKADVPNNDITKLMYYLKSVFYVIQYDVDKKLVDFMNYYNLTNEEEETVVLLYYLIQKY